MHIRCNYGILLSSEVNNRHKLILNQMQFNHNFYKLPVELKEWTQGSRKTQYNCCTKTNRKGNIGYHL